MSDHFPARIENVPYTYAETIIASAVLASMDAEVRDFLRDASLTEQQRSLAEGIISQLDMWRTWVATHRPVPPNTVTNVADIQRFDMLVFADMDDMERRTQLLRGQLRRTRRLSVWLPLAGLGLFGTLIWWTAAKKS